METCFPRQSLHRNGMHQPRPNISDLIKLRYSLQRCDAAEFLDSDERDAPGHGSRRCIPAADLFRRVLFLAFSVRCTMTTSPYLIAITCCSFRPFTETL